MTVEPSTGNQSTNHESDLGGVPRREVDRDLVDQTANARLAHRQIQARFGSPSARVVQRKGKTPTTLGTKKVGKRSFEEIGPGRSKWQRTFQRRFGQGQRMHGYKAGSEKSGRATQLAMRGTPTQRAWELWKILKTGKGTRHVADVASFWLAGGDPDQLRVAFREVSKGKDLDATIDRVFAKNSIRRHVLRRTFDKGEPDLYCRLAVEVGHGSKAGVLRLIEEADPGEVEETFKNSPEGRKLKLRVAKMLQGKRKLGHSSARKRMNAALEVKQIEAGDHIDKQALYEAKRQHLIRVYEDHMTLGNLDRTAFMKELNAWVAREKKDVRDAVAAEDKSFAKHLAGKWFRANERRYLLRCVKSKQPVEASFLAGPGGKKSELSKEESEIARTEAAEKIVNLKAYLVRKADRGIKNRFEKWAKLSGQIEAMSDDERQWLLRSFLDESQQAEWDLPTTTPNRRKELHDTGIRHLRFYLTRAGCKGSTQDRMVSGFAYGAVSGATRSNNKSAYRQLKQLAAGKAPFLVKRGSHWYTDRALKLVTELSPSEYLTVRNDKTLMKELERRCKREDKRKWYTIRAILQYRIKSVDVTGSKRLGIQGDGSGSGHGKVGRLHTKDREKLLGFRLDSAKTRALGANIALLEPLHWSALLGIELNKGRFKCSHASVQSLISQAFEQAARRKELPDLEDSRRPEEIPDYLRPIPIRDFMHRVYGLLDAGAKKVLNSKDLLFRYRFKEERLALVEGRAISAEKRIASASVTKLNLFRWIKTGGAKKEQVLQAIQDASGQALLDEWSNVAVWKALTTERKQLQANPKRSARENTRLAFLNTEIDQFMVDVNPNIRAMLEKRLWREDLVEVLTALRNKLADAMTGDARFMLAMDDAGITHDSFAAESTRVLGALERQQIEDTGAQYEKFSGKSTRRKQQTNAMVGRWRSANQSITKAGAIGETEKSRARTQVNVTDTPRIADSRVELQKRTEAFAAMRRKAKAIIDVALMIAASAVAAIAAGVISLALPQGTPIWAFALVAMATTLGAGLGQMAISYALEGDRHKGSSEFADLVVKTLLSGASAGLLKDAGLQSLLLQIPGLNDQANLLQILFRGLIKNGLYNITDQGVRRTKAVLEGKELSPQIFAGLLTIVVRSGAAVSLDVVQAWAAQQRGLFTYNVKDQEGKHGDKGEWVKLDKDHELASDKSTLQTVEGYGQTGGFMALGLSKSLVSPVSDYLAGHVHKTFTPTPVKKPGSQPEYSQRGAYQRVVRLTAEARNQIAALDKNLANLKGPRAKLPQVAKLRQARRALQEFLDHKRREEHENLTKRGDAIEAGMKLLGQRWMAVVRARPLEES